MKDLKQIQEDLKTLFPNEYIDVVVDVVDGEEHIFAKFDDLKTFRFQDMPKMAEAFGTDKLDFGKTEDEPGYRYSSWTWDSGTPGVLFVRAYY